MIADGIIDEFVAIIREVETIERNCREACKHKRTEARLTVESGLAQCAKHMSRDDRLFSASRFYWGAQDVGGAKTILGALGFGLPIGFPKHGLPFLVAAEKCGECGGDMLKTNRGCPAFCRRYCGYDPRNIEKHQVSLEGFIASRGLVAFNEDSQLQWVRHGRT